MEQTVYGKIEKTVSELYITALKKLPEDVIEALVKARNSENNQTGAQVLSLISRNISVARDKNLIVCQDTGTPVCLVEAGNCELDITQLYEAIGAGVRSATLNNNLRPNMVHPITRANSGDNTGIRSPEIILEPNPSLGKSLKITVIPKGSGSENMSTLFMLTLSDGVPGLKERILRWVVEIGGKGCPPYVVGIGIGGSFDMAARLSKIAVSRPIGSRSEDKVISGLEDDLYAEINRLGVGPMGLGGNTTAIGVNIEWAETHISSLPVAINIQCWRDERASAILGEEGTVNFV